MTLWEKQWVVKIWLLTHQTLQHLSAQEFSSIVRKHNIRSYPKIVLEPYKATTHRRWITVLKAYDCIIVTKCYSWTVGSRVLFCDNVTIIWLTVLVQEYYFVAMLQSYGSLCWFNSTILWQCYNHVVLEQWSDGLCCGRIRIKHDLGIWSNIVWLVYCWTGA